MKVIKLAEVDSVDVESYFKKTVVIPTETVYGLAARIDNEEALKSIFKIKGRPADNPLIVHISDLEMLPSLIEGEIPEEYKKLMDLFWPGPLTLLFKCKGSISPIITGGDTQKTVAIRMPKNEKLRKMIRKIGVPLAAPSANTSGKPSPTSVEHVIEDFGEKVDLYIDGGQCEVGLESTVFGIINGQCTILRPGGVTMKEIKEALGCEIQVRNKTEKGQKVMCPGQKYTHYSPTHPVYLFKGVDWQSKIAKYKNDLSNLRIGLLKRLGLPYPVEFEENYILGSSLKECTGNIFSGLRDLDKKCDALFVVGFELDDEGLAIMDRLEKAARYVIE
ncbi:hypothetical protein GINT2_001133 [Glugoides intestinalis]